MLFSGLVGCKAEQAEPPTPTLGEQAQKWANERGLEVSKTLVREFPDGSLHHLEFVAKSDQRKLGTKLAMKGDGSIVPLTQAQAQFDAEYLERWGRVDRGALSVWTKAKKRMLVAVTLSDITPEVKSAIYSLDASATFEQKPFHHVYAKLKVEDWLKLKDVEQVIRVDLVGMGATEYADPNTEGSSHHSRSSSRFNDHGYYAEGVNIGIVEAAGYGCGIWPDHEAFQFNTVTPQLTQACSFSTDCNCGFVNGGVRPGVCVNGECVREHAHQVAGRISHSSSDPHHAAYSNIFVANAGDIEYDINVPTASALSMLANRYDWLLQNEVFIVNESWGQTEYFKDIEQIVPTFRDSLQEYYARYHGITFVRAAGNLISHESLGQEVDCHSLNALCVGFVNDNNTVFDDPDQYLDDEWESQSYRNPFSVQYKSYPDTDIERPDLATAGYQVPVPQVTGTGDWTDGTGTSYSAPVVTGSLALLQECRGGEPISPIRNRAIFRNSASVIQSVEHANSNLPNPVPLYPTTGWDWEYDTYIGAGIHHAAGLSCDPDEPAGCGEGIECGDTEFELNLEGGEPLDPSFFDPNMGSPVFGSPTTDSSAEGLNLLVRDGAFQKRQWKIKTFEGLDVGSRVRGELAWYACAPNDTSGSVAELGVGIDIDLVLCAPGIGCEAVSESIHDNSEGFDVILSDSYSEISLYAIWEDQRDEDGNVVPNLDCNGAAFTPMAAAWRYKRK